MDPLSGSMKLLNPSWFFSHNYNITNKNLFFKIEGDVELNKASGKNRIGEC